MKEHDCVYRHRALPPRDSDYRSRPSRRQTRRRGAVPGAVGLVGRTEDSRSGAQTRKAAGVESGGKREAAWFGSGFYRVGALAILTFGGGDLQTHLLAHGTREE